VTQTRDRALAAKILAPDKNGLLKVREFASLLGGLVGQTLGKILNKKAQVSGSGLKPVAVARFLPSAQYAYGASINEDRRIIGLRERSSPAK